MWQTGCRKEGSTLEQINRAVFGAFVSQLRREKGLTQRQLAETLHISDKAVSKWETGVSHN